MGRSHRHRWDDHRIIDRFGEPRVSMEVAKAEQVLEDTLVASLFLHIRTLKGTELPSTR